MAIVEKGLMGRQDKLLSFGATGAIGAAGTYNCGGSDGNALDLNASSLNGFAVHFKVSTALAGGTNATFKVCVSSDKSNWTDAAVSPAITTANLGADAEVTVAVPKGAPAARYVKACVVTTGTHTAGVVEAMVDTFAGI